MTTPFLRLAAGTFAVVAALGASSCNTVKKVTACPDDVACTMMFASVGVYITDAAGKPYQLDEAYTINVSTGETIHLEASGAGVGHYTVLDDSYRKKLQNRTARFQFIGIKDNQRIIEEPYTFSADCCHISKVSGRETVVLK